MALIPTRFPSKVCFKCLKEKELTDFYKHPRMADGHLNKCKECTKKDVRANRRQRIDYYREYDRQRYQTPERREAQRLYFERQVSRYPERRNARNALSNAIRDGRVKRRDACEQCGSTWHVHGHHEDYSKPLDVIWLCVRCHVRLHSKKNHSTASTPISPSSASGMSIEAARDDGRPNRLERVAKDERVLRDHVCQYVAPGQGDGEPPWPVAGRRLGK